MRIGIFDSGIGGLTVLKEALSLIPSADYVYYADTGNVPYGTKSKEEVKKLVLEAAEFLASKNIDALVIACNTATSIGVQELRMKYDFPVIGMEPAIKVALEKEKEKAKNKKVLVMATALTLAEEKFKNLVHSINGESKVVPLAMPELVTFAENFDFNSEKVLAYLENAFSKYSLNEFGEIVLGCTHFIYFKEIIQNLIPNHIEIIDGNYGTVKNLKKTLENTVIFESLGNVEFFSSASGDVEKKSFQKYLDYLGRNK